MEALGSGAAPEGAAGGEAGGEADGEADAGAARGAGRAGRRGRRRVVAPPTSGQSHEVESDFTDPFSDSVSAADPVTGSGAEGSSQSGDSAGKTARLTTRKPERSSPEAPLTAHEQWILSQRPPHWE